jgi:hypothetical protein
MQRPLGFSQSLSWLIGEAALAMVWSDNRSIIKSSMRDRRVVNRLGRTWSASFRLFAVSILVDSYHFGL